MCLYRDIADILIILFCNKGPPSRPPSVNRREEKRAQIPLLDFLNKIE